MTSENPAEVAVGSSLALTSEAHDTDHAPGPLTYAWTAAGGTIASPAAQNTAFTCTEVGTFTVTLAAADGDCNDRNLKPIFWSDDSNFGAHALRRDSIPCGHFPL